MVGGSKIAFHFGYFINRMRPYLKGADDDDT